MSTKVEYPIFEIIMKRLVNQPTKSFTMRELMDHVHETLVDISMPEEKKKEERVDDYHIGDF
uniref:Uncharacterized protein n=1 Tax=Mimivirus LCMiAC01 TaxID=2506608 RepID=A0A481Z1R4_9VIRU|nr:MAG: hypothetical protein LCMiAC01_03920 [Mimivirus LCMiAC01]